MTVSLDATVTEVRRYFRDVKWSTDTLKAWVRDAVRDYSRHFPQLKETQVIAVADQYEYAINDLVLAVIEVEYPTGEDPPEFPEQRNHREPHFFGDGVSYYDIVAYPGMQEAELWLSDIDAGEIANIKYYTSHDWTASGTDYRTDIPDVDRHILVQYVIWQCWREILTIERETADADRRAYLQEQAADAASAYNYYIQMLKSTHSAESSYVKWEMDKFDRIY